MEDNPEPILTDLAHILRKHGWECTPPPDFDTFKASLPMRLQNVMTGAGIKSMSELVRQARSGELSQHRNVGSKTMEVARQKLSDEGYPMPHH